MSTQIKIDNVEIDVNQFKPMRKYKITVKSRSYNLMIDENKNIVMLNEIDEGNGVQRIGKVCGKNINITQTRGTVETNDEKRHHEIESDQSINISQTMSGNDKNQFQKICDIVSDGSINISQTWTN